jgi:uncharacterized protein (DUF2384 family)
MLSKEISYEDKGLIAGMIIQLLDNWSIDSANQITFLSLPEKTPLRAIRKYRQNTPFPESEELNEKIKHLIGIADALRTTFPRNAEMGSQWMNKPHRRFDGRTPINLMLEEGVKGFVTVRSQLDCAFAWEDSER